MFWDEIGQLLQAICGIEKIECRPFFAKSMQTHFGALANRNRLLSYTTAFRKKSMSQKDNFTAQSKVITMVNFKRSDLKLRYSWTASAESDNAKIVGFPDNVRLNRHEGYEVLPFLNRYMTDKGWKQKSTLNKLEDALRDELPGDIQSHINIRKWLNDNFII